MGRIDRHVGAGLRVTAWAHTRRRADDQACEHTATGLMALPGGDLWGRQLALPRRQLGTCSTTPTPAPSAALGARA